MVKKKTQSKETIVQANKQEPEQEMQEINDGLKLSKEQLLTLRISHLEREFLQKEVESKFRHTEILERDKTIANLQLSDLKSKLTRKGIEHKALIEEMGRKLGIDLKNSSINPETGEITLS